MKTGDRVRIPSRDGWHTGTVTGVQDGISVSVAWDSQPYDPSTGLGRKRGEPRLRVTFPWESARWLRTGNPPILRD